MKTTLVGIDLGGLGAQALTLLKSLGLKDRKTLLVNAVEPLLPDGESPLLSEGHPLMTLMADQAKYGEIALGQAIAGHEGEKFETRQVVGTPLEVLLNLQKETHADLIAVGSTSKGWLEGMFLGSVTKGLASSAPCSILVSKHVQEAGRPIRLLLGFDGSEHSHHCLRQLVELAPGNVESIVIAGAVLAPPIQSFASEGTYMEGVPIDALTDAWRHTAERLRLELLSICESVTLEVHAGEPNDVLNSLMADHDADLLVLGAKGSGFFESLILGSVAMHQVVREHNNVLILRG